MHRGEGELLLKELGRQLRARRLLRSISQEQLAREANLSTRFVSELEAGRGNISILRLFELTRALGVPLHEMVRLESRRRLLALVGLRGAGKSTVGRLLAKQLERPFVELDRLIEEEAGLGLDELFALHGESYYRRLEREVLTRFVSDARPAVLATGGGLVTDRATYDLLKGSAVTVWLKTRPALHLSRVAAQGDRRPMAGRADPLAELHTLLREREPLYAEAEITVDTSDLAPDDTAREVLERLGATRGLREEARRAPA